MFLSGSSLCCSAGPLRSSSPQHTISCRTFTRSDLTQFSLFKIVGQFSGLHVPSPSRGKEKWLSCWHWIGIRASSQHRLMLFSWASLYFCSCRTSMFPDLSATVALTHASLLPLVLLSCTALLEIKHSFWQLAMKLHCVSVCPHLVDPFLATYLHVEAKPR